MYDLWLRISQHQHYATIIFGTKCLVASIVLVSGLLIGVGKSGYPLSPESLYDAMIKEEFVLDDLHTSSIQTKSLNDLLAMSPTDEWFARDWAHYFFELDTAGHHSAGDNVTSDQWTTLYNQTCQQYQPICSKLVFHGDRLPKDKFIYTILSAYFATRIDQSLAPSHQLFPNLHSLTLRSQVSTNKSDPLCFRERRGCADHHTVMLNISLLPSYAEFVHVLVHEIAGHTVDLGVIKGISRELSDEYREFGNRVFSVDDASLGFYQLSWQGETVRKKGARMNEFCSLYGMTNMFEDFAECALMFKNHNEYFRILARSNRTMAKKYQYFANLFGNSPIITHSPWAQHVGDDRDARVRDLTKIY
ncbi:MAG: hypothetical protein NZL83_01580 [Candidatus Absconditabacterales bacterium]|nr:hypothetical protein [Candidatus Absconditabacterales bacterium]